MAGTPSYKHINVIDLDAPDRPTSFQVHTQSRKRRISNGTHENQQLEERVRFLEQIVRDGQRCIRIEDLGEEQEPEVKREIEREIEAEDSDENQTPRVKREIKRESEAEDSDEDQKPTFKSEMETEPNNPQLNLERQLKNTKRKHTQLQFQLGVYQAEKRKAEVRDQEQQSLIDRLHSDIVRLRDQNSQTETRYKEEEKRKRELFGQVVDLEDHKQQTANIVRAHADLKNSYDGKIAELQVHEQQAKSNTEDICKLRTEVEHLQAYAQELEVPGPEKEKSSSELHTQVESLVVHNELIEECCRNLEAEAELHKKGEMGDLKPEWMQALENSHLADMGRLKHECSALIQGFARAMKLLRVGEELPSDAQELWRNTSYDLFDETKRNLEDQYCKLKG
ncbi:hypothetical protein BLS_008551 [Venturia inaequalis]|uniref:Uncharacterized protein n=1 Tax=Venturia inaequalis TaxID=5025 RepID=A0A8H3V3N8_VENIN|nr:hypothetical protein BLS_008551 [Venturia inaequalis]KAE9981643.1 hypothetical protein EG328_011477 [Venturia inaequalis]KAE9991567.1 hypothetical protein EG327_011469 [Venturia inaequalis]